jgi:hypothetical protein
MAFFSSLFGPPLQAIRGAHERDPRGPRHKQNEAVQRCRHGDGTGCASFSQLVTNGNSDNQNRNAGLPT